MFISMWQIKTNGKKIQTVLFLFVSLSINLFISFFSISENFGSTPAITNPMYMLLKPSPISLESSSHVKHKLDLEWNAQSYGTQSQEFLLMETYELTMFPSHKKVQVKLQNFFSQTCTSVTSSGYWEGGGEGTLVTATLRTRVFLDWW